MNYLLLSFIPAPAIFGFFWCKDILRQTVRRFCVALQQYTPRIPGRLKNPALSRREFGRNFLTYIQSKEYAELDDPEITHLGQRVERLHISTVLLAFVIIGYYYALVISYFLTHP